MIPEQPRLPAYATPLIFAALALGINADLLFSSTRVLGHMHSDMTAQFLAWREFAFGEMRSGNLPLWNPHIFGGVPFAGGWQSALFYPLNWLHLILPDNIAINWIISIHLFLAGWLMSRWCRSGGSSQPAALLAGICWMFSGPYFLHVYAGHLPHLCLLAWTPLLYQSLDQSINGWRLPAILTGALAVAMMALAGHPQYVYYTAIVTAPYVLLRAIDSPQRWRFLAVSGAMAVFGAALAAVQLLSGLDASREFIRAGGLDYTYASAFSFPPENLLTAVVPGFFGSLPSEAAVSTPPEYFGRCYLWEVSIFFSGTGLLLAMLGWHGVTFVRRQWFWTVMIVLTAALAVGAHTPLHRLLFDYLPGFSSFRGCSKFAYLLVMILCRLTADGWDRLERQPRAALPGIIAAALAVFALALGLWARWSMPKVVQSTFGQLLRDNLEAATEANELFLSPRLLASAAFYSDAAATAARACWWSGGAFAAALLIVFLARRWKIACHAVILLAAVEMIVFAFANRASTQAYPEWPAVWNEVLRSLPSDARVHVMNPGRVNHLMIRRAYAVWGYDPLLQRRYGELMAASQGIAPKDASTYLAINRMPGNLSSLLRCAAVFQDNPEQPAVILRAPPMPLASLVTTAIVVPQRDELLRLLFSPQMDPRFTVLLEAPPAIELSHSPAPGRLQTRRIDTDTIHIQAELSASAMLLITENYSRGWRIRSDSGINRDAIRPANYAFMGIALPAGKHDFILEFRPAAYQWGGWISLFSVAAFFALGMGHFYSRRGASGSDN